jgi:hypothetical protein
MAKVWSAEAAATGDATGVAGSAVGVETDARDAAVELANRATWRRLRMAGWSAEEAGNLVGFLAGLPVGRQAWTLREVENLMFIRRMVDQGRISA